MSSDLPALAGSSVLAIISAFVGVMLWVRKDMKEYFCKEMDEVKAVIQKDRDRLAEVLDKMLQNDIDAFSRISRLEGEVEKRG